PGKSNIAAHYLKRRNEIVEMESDLALLEERQVKAVEKVDQQLVLMDEINRSFQKVDKNIIELDLHILGLEKEITAKSMISQRLVVERANLIKEAEQTNKVQKQFKEEIERISQHMDQNEKDQRGVQQKMVSQRRLMDDLRSEKEDLQDELQQTQISHNNLINRQNTIHNTKQRLEKDHRDAGSQLEKISQRLTSMGLEEGELTKSLDSFEVEIPRLYKVLSELENNLRGKSDAIELERGKLLERQKKIQEYQKEFAEFTEDNHKLDIKLAQITQEAANIESNLFSEFSITPQDLIQTFNLDEFDLKKEALEIKKLKVRVADNVHVNLAAKEEYDTLVERLAFLQTQSQDLRDSMEALENSIQKINRESRKRFRTTFDQINDKFSNLFPKLFGGGEAYLQLTDENNLLETGVEIIAKPPGKKLQNMTLLSGGEKAMTAIAMIFAIFQIKPSPFCLLDEVDAPLDETNSGRFNQHVVAMTENSQFIIITHNKKTMEIGDALFGVTMEEPGTSKVVSVDFRKAELAEMVS
ncbi:MAG: hypothetical protein GY786_16030, partial [Proteobacteria bacterium]|nr:hypothetical protein [Pseudomonadota bacterium]